MTTINKEYIKTVKCKSGDIKEYKSVISYNVKNTTGVKLTDLKSMIKNIKSALTLYNKISPYQSDYCDIVKKVKQILEIIKSD